MDIGLKILTISIKSALFMDKGWHKAGGASPLGVARAACFEELAGVFASSGASLEKTDDDTLTKKRTILC